jgi:hypothetical protein
LADDFEDSFTSPPDVLQVKAQLSFKKFSPDVLPANFSTISKQNKRFSTA